MSWSTSELRVSLARRETGLSPPVKYFYWPFQGSASFVDHLCYFCLVFVVLLCTSVYWCLDKLWSPAGKELTSWLSFLMSNCEVVTFPLVSWVRSHRCGAWLYWFLIFALFLTLKKTVYQYIFFLRIILSFQRTLYCIWPNNYKMCIPFLIYIYVDSVNPDQLASVRIHTV